MKCNDVRAQLSLIRPDSGDADQPEFASEMMHLEQCADCQAYWAAQQQTDRQLGRAMRNVAIPADFKSRLMAQLSASIEASADSAAVSTSAEPAVMATKPETITTATALPTTVIQPLPRTRPANQAWTRRRAATVTSAALLLLAFGSWFFLKPPSQPQLTVLDLLALAHSPETLSAPRFQQSFQPVLPSSEIRTPNKGSSVKPQSVRYKGHEIGALYHYAAGRSRTPNVVLVVIDLNRVVVSNLAAVGSSFVGAQVEYPPPHSYATRTWRVGTNLYVCYVQSRIPEDLDRLKTQNVVS